MQCTQSAVVFETVSCIEDLAMLLVLPYFLAAAAGAVIMGITLWARARAGHRRALIRGATRVRRFPDNRLRNCGVFAPPWMPAKIRSTW